MLACFKMGEFQQAKNYHQKALEIRKTQLGPNHNDVATSYLTGLLKCTLR